MSFHFKRLRVKDWLVYGGEVDLEFPDFQQGRNLIVVNGSNGFGKTSLLKALSFVFHGQPTKAELRDDLWNHRAREAEEGSLEVSIEFTHAGKACTLVRGADFRPWGNGVAVTPWVKLFTDGTEDRDQVDDKIEQMLPRDCLEFLFFDGAEISRYAQKQHREGVREAIEKVLGIPAIRNLREDLSGVVRNLEEEQQTLLGQAQQAQALLADIEALRDEEENYQQRRSAIVERKTSLESTKAELEAEAEGIQTIERERHELAEKRRRKADLEDRRRELDAKIRAAISRAPLYLMQDTIRQIVEELRARQMPSPRRDGHLARLRMMSELLQPDQQQCLCKREINEDIREVLRREVEQLEGLLRAAPQPDASTGSDLLELRTLLRVLESERQDPDELIDRRAAVETQIEEIDTDIYRLRQSLEGHDEVTVSELFQQVAQLVRKIAEADGEMRTLDQNLERTRTALQQKQRELDSIGAGNEQARGVTRLLEEARRARQAVSELVESLVEQQRCAIEERATEIFSRITNKPEEYARLRVKEDYTLEVIRRDDSVVENHKLSAGEKEVVAYSFITALNLASVDPAPFVMDTPFGHLDSGHRSGLLRSLPQLEVQAILLATDRDLPPSERDAIDGAIGREFTLVRDQRRAVTNIRED
jgi:DNA sulfur modification protein DndD